MYQPLSSPLTRLRSHYDVVVIGSGYGGAIAACRLAQARRDGKKLSVCVLERGRETGPGSYPNTTLSFAGMAQLTTDAGVVGERDRLFDFRATGDMGLILGCGLGGTSLINAGVAIAPKDWVIQDAAWPKGLRQDLPRFHRCLDKARKMLGSTPYPESRPKLGKLAALKKSAVALKAPFSVVDVNVSFEAHANEAGTAMKACNLCGDCATGCNHGAKNTTLMNYLPMARRHGAELFTQVEVEYLERKGDGWIVHYAPLGGDRAEFTADLGFVSADLVVLGAGSVGSTEILLRSKAKGLPLSDLVGHRFSGNGDVLGFGYNCTVGIHAVGAGDEAVDHANPPGPCISGLLDLRDLEATPELGMVIQEGVIPGAFAPGMPLFLSASAALVGTDTTPGVVSALGELGREVTSLVGGSHRGALANTQTFMVMCHDAGDGQLHLDTEHNRAQVKWPGAGDAAWLKHVDSRLKQATAAIGGTHIPDPVWSKWMGNKLVVSHPLGGAAMAESAELGVVDHKGNVFSSQHGTAVYPNLYVDDGAAVARSVGVNPLLTISALAERSMELLIEARGWTVDTSLPALPVTRPKVGLRFTERMAGMLALGDTLSYLADGWENDVVTSKADFVVQVQSDDLHEVLDTRGHLAQLTGTLHLPGLHPDPLQMEDGAFTLFVEDADDAGTRYMRYRFVAVTEDGQPYYFDGEKVVRDDPGFDVIEDTTTLFVSMHQGKTAHGKQVARGILKVHFDDLIKSLTTIEVLNAPSTVEKGKALLRCGEYFFGSLAATYLK